MTVGFVVEWFAVASICECGVRACACGECCGLRGECGLRGGEADAALDSFEKAVWMCASEEVCSARCGCVCWALCDRIVEWACVGLLRWGSELAMFAKSCGDRHV